MKVLLVNPITRNVSLSSPDLGLGYLAKALENKNHQVDVLDCVNLKMTFKKFEDYIVNHFFDVIGFRVFSTDLPSVKKSLLLVKKRSPHAKIILGGAHPSVFPEQTLQYFKEADFAFRGEAEIGLAELICNFLNLDETRKTQIPGLIWRNKGEIKSNPQIFPEDLDSLGHPDWNLINPCNYPFQTSYLTKSKIVAPLIMTRGCPYQCSFCSCRSVTGHKIRSHSVSYIIEEIKFLKTNFGINEVCFIDDNFLFFKDMVSDLCEQLIKQKINIKWSCFGIRLDLIDKDMLSLMEKAGCYLLTVGIESGSQRILDHMKKKLTLDLIKRKINLIHTETHVKIIGNFILGYPLEKEEDIYKTVQLANSLPISGANFFPFHPTPGTEIFDELLAKKELKTIDWDLMGQDRRPYIPQGISKQKFTWLFVLAFLSFYMRPRIILNVLLATRSLERLKYIFRRLFIFIR
ncbi:radical sam domain protein [hydrocarbon metagenome]|uniref:Radical sam domain protein n=1 Tax=hydrocarbon metagenome TaxID=938273 RepID=A0A0W8FUN1_9ZZZZ